MRSLGRVDSARHPVPSRAVIAMIEVGRHHGMSRPFR
jgi:hypothetical protein